MTHTEIKLQTALNLIKTMGSIIRQLDENSTHCQYWLNDGTEEGNDYVPAAIELALDTE